MNFAEMGTEYKVNDKYSIQIAKGDYLAIEVPVLYGSSAAKFDHVNIKATNRKVLEFKHYRSGGSKFWTAKPGLSYVFLLPKEKIELNEEKSGYSYVHVVIGGQDYCLSVSGGTSGNGWTDWIPQGSSTFVHHSAKKLQAIADAADYDGDIFLSSCVRVPDEHEQKYYRRLCAYHDTRNKLQKGDKLFLEGCDYEGSKGPFDIIERPKRKRYFKCVSNSYHSWVKVKYSQIDWVKTAEINDVALV